MPIFFVEKNVRSFCSAKASLSFSTKNFSVFGYKVVKHLTSWGWSGGAMVLGKLPVPGRPTNLD